MKKMVPIAVVVGVADEYWRGVVQGIVKFIAPANPGR